MAEKTIDERIEEWRGAFRAMEADEDVEHGERMRLVREGAALAREWVRDVGGGAGEADDELEGLAADFAGSHGDGLRAAAVKLVEAAGKLKPEPRRAVAVPDAPKERPLPLLRLVGRTGAVLTIGSVGVLSGAGGAGKSALVSSLALALAGRGRRTDGDKRLAGGLFEAPTGGGPVLLAQWEDEPSVTRFRIERAEERLGLDDAKSRVYLMGMEDPIFGVPAGGAFNAIPERLPAWRELWGEVERLKAEGHGPRLVVIDPAMSAYGGNANDVSAVRAFLMHGLKAEAKANDCSVLVVAHSTKAARNEDADLFDPGQIAGSGAWTDGVRSAMVLRRVKGSRFGREDDALCLMVSKSNYGPERLGMPLEPVRVDAADREDGGAIVAFKAGAKSWEAPAESEGGPKANASAKTTDGSGLDKWRPPKKS